jgi:hypothetical protein
MPYHPEEIAELYFGARQRLTLRPSYGPSRCGGCNERASTRRRVVRDAGEPDSCNGCRPQSPSPSPTGSRDFNQAAKPGDRRRHEPSRGSGVSYISGGGADDQLVTSDATLDVSHTKIYNFVVLSTNAIGTTFTVRDVATAFTIVGGPGQDTIVFTADQRNAIFTTASIEKIIDATGTYTASPVNAPPSLSGVAASASFTVESARSPRSDHRRLNRGDDPACSPKPDRPRGRSPVQNSASPEYLFAAHASEKPMWFVSSRLAAK